MTTEVDGEDEPGQSPVTFEMDVRSDRTIITIDGQRDGAVVVQSESGEKVYLPPEDAVKESDPEEYGASPYSPAGAKEGESSYQSIDEDSPYQRSDDDSDESFGRRSVPQGIRIIHPEPVTDVRFLR